MTFLNIRFELLAPKENKMKSRFKPTRIALMFWTIFIGFGALWGSIAMFLSPDGSILRMEGLLPYKIHAGRLPSLGGR